MPVRAAEPATVFLEEMTWTEVRDAIAAGRTTVIVPVGGTEQSGPPAPDRPETTTKSRTGAALRGSGARRGAVWSEVGDMLWRSV